MSLQALARLVRSHLPAQQPMQQGQCYWQNRLASNRCSSSTGTSSSTAGRARTAEQMSDDELKAALPSMLFTTSNLIWSTTLAIGVATAGLLCMFQVGSWITGAAAALKHPDAPAAPAPAPPPKSLAELIAERKAELEQQLTELETLPRTSEVRAAISATKKELQQFRPPGQSWWRW